MKTGGDFHKDLEKDLKNPKFYALFLKERERLKLTERLRGAMKKSRLSVRRLATLMGTSKSQVERIISDPKANIGIDTLIKFAAVTGRRIEISLR